MNKCEYDLGFVKLKYKNSKKQQYFEYVVLQLADWWIKSNPNKSFEENDLGRLKIYKLLFFISSCKTNAGDDGLLNIFNNWVATPYGHVELDIQNIDKYLKGEFDKFTITNSKLIIK